MRLTSAVPFVRAQDIVWLVLFSALGAVSPYRTQPEILMLVALAAFQLMEPRIPYFSGDGGIVIGILIKLVLCYLLIGWTGGITSTYYLILLLPVVSAATSLTMAGMIGITFTACAAYLSFLLYLDWRRWELSPAAAGELGLRIIFLSVVGFLTHQLAAANRVEARKYQAAAEQLSAANQSLQEAEAAVRRSERLAALGQLTAGLAHELRNPLGTIRASAEMLGKNAAAHSEVGAELAGFISSEVDRLNSLITRFLEFARPLNLRRQAVNVNELLDGCIGELQRTSPSTTIHRNYAPDIPTLQLDSELMQRVFYNLLLNAAQASVPAGSVTLKTRKVDGDVEISVIDRGYGIAPEHLESIFNPFFTTKSEGIGLGLAIVSKIVDEHRGKIVVESEAGQGSNFRVFLPV